MTESERDAAIVKVADAVNQIAIVVESMAYYCSQNGYLDITNPRRAGWMETVRQQRELIAELIPE